MRHKITEDVTVQLKLELPIADADHLIDKIVNGALVVITASAVAHILKQAFNKEAS